MKIIIISALILLGGILSAPPVLAAGNGACSWHGGVDCSAGPNIFGAAICNDGFESDVRFGSILECTNNPNKLFFCHTRRSCDSLYKVIEDEVQSIERDHNETIARINSIESDQMNRVEENCRAARSRAEIAIAGARLTGSPTGDNYLQGVQNQCDSEKNRVRENIQGLRSKAEVTKNSLMRIARLWRLRIVENIYSCPNNSTALQDSGLCACNTGFYSFGGMCILNAPLPTSPSVGLNNQSTNTLPIITPNQPTPTVEPSSSTIGSPIPVTPLAPSAATSTTVTPAPCLTGFIWDVSTLSCKEISTVTINTQSKYFIGLPKTKSDLLNCIVVGNVKTKKYYLRGNKYIKTLSPSGKQCFQSEIEAKSKKYKKV